MTVPALPTPDFSRFPRHAELTALLQAYAAARPDVVELRSIGKSHEGRDIWLLVLTRKATGADVGPSPRSGSTATSTRPSSRPAPRRCTTCTTCSPTRPPTTRLAHLLDTRVVYIVPRLNPDGAELALADVPRFIRSSTRGYPFDEEPPDGMTMEDVDGDGRVLYMRIPDPHGTYRKHPQEPRLMIAREPGEIGGEYFRVIPEGTLKAWDGVRVNASTATARAST